MRSDTEKPVTAATILNAVRSFSFSAVFGGAIEWLLSTYKKLLNHVDPDPVPLPPEDRAALEKLLAPATQELEALRQSTVNMVDNRARVLVPLAAIAVLLLTRGGKGDASVGPVFALIAAVATYVAISYRPASRYANAVKSQYGVVMADWLSGFSYVAKADFVADRFKAWRFFPDVMEGQVTDRMTGQRDSREVSLSHVFIKYGRNRRNSPGRTPSILFLCVEMQTKPFPDEGITVIQGRDSDSRLQAAPLRKHGLTEVALNDDWFDTRYKVHSSTPDLLPVMIGLDMAAALARLEADLEPQYRPHVVMMPGYMAVLFPMHGQHVAMEPDPFWIPLDAEGTLSRFATDLAVLHRHLVLALSLAKAAGR